MTKPELLAELERLREVESGTAHVKADQALIEYIGDWEVKVAYGRIKKGYA